MEPPAASSAAEPDGGVQNLAELADPTRRQLYEFLTHIGRPVRRDEAAEGVGITRALAAYHLDRLADAGLLAVTYKRPAGRSGPGAGRPAKRYHPTSGDIHLTIPPRNYPFVAQLLADVVGKHPDTHPTLMCAAHQEGKNTGTKRVALIEQLRASGYEPYRNADGDICLRNCPFHPLATRHTELVCTMNVEFLRGLLQGRGEEPSRARLSAKPNQCCVVITPHGKEAA